MLLSLILTILGAALVTTAAAMVSPPLGVAVAGLWMLGLAVGVLPDRWRR